MRLLANENVPGPLVEALSVAGCDVAWIRLVSPGATDVAVLALAAAEHRILLTFDKDFGELARSAHLPLECGVILLRLPMPRPSEFQRLAGLIRSGTNWSGQFSVVEPGRIRTRPLPVGPVERS